MGGGTGILIIPSNFIEIGVITIYLGDVPVVKGSYHAGPGRVLPLRFRGQAIAGIGRCMAVSSVFPGIEGIDEVLGIIPAHMLDRTIHAAGSKIRGIGASHNRQPLPLGYLGGLHVIGF